MKYIIKIMQCQRKNLCYRNCGCNEESGLFRPAECLKIIEENFQASYPLQFEELRGLSP